jgi:hypothetical protein
MALDTGFRRCDSSNHKRRRTASAEFYAWQQDLAGLIAASEMFIRITL